jgi:hypothetical protein
MPARILLVEDDEPLLLLLRYNLKVEALAGQPQLEADVRPRVRLPQALDGVGIAGAALPWIRKKMLDDQVLSGRRAVAIGTRASAILQPVVTRRRWNVVPSEALRQFNHWVTREGFEVDSRSLEHRAGELRGGRLLNHWPAP